MRDPGFKYQVGDFVTHVGFLKPVRQPVVQQFQVISCQLVVGPGWTHRFYVVRPAKHAAKSFGSSQDTLRMLEESLASLPQTEQTDNPSAETFN
jgi:hypothetical protein